MTAQHYPAPLVPADVDLRDKRLANLQAQAALKGYALHIDPMGGYYVTWRGCMRAFDDLEEFEVWFERVTGEAA